MRPRSRRALLAGLLGGVAASLAGAVGRVTPASAAAGDPIRMGQGNFAGGSNTTLTTNSSGSAYKVVQNGAGLAVRAESADGSGVSAVAKTRHKFGVVAENAAGGSGVGGAIKAVGKKNHGVVASSNGNARYAMYATHPGTSSGSHAVVGRITSSAAGSITAGVLGMTASTFAGSYGVWGRHAGAGFGVLGDSVTGSGVYGVAYGTTGENAGVTGQSASASGYAGWFWNSSTNGVAVLAEGQGSGRTKATLQVHNTHVGGGAMAAYITVNSNFATAHVRNDGTGEVLYLQNGGTDAAGTGGGDFIKATNNPENDAQFRVLTSGEVRSDVGFNTPAADFAEMLDAEPGLEAGDVLAIGDDGRLTRSHRPHQENVAGVYSTAPGFVGGKPVEGARAGHVPLAVVGIVPVKASAENGAISPGDLLTSSATPGHAMRANGEARVGCVIGKALRPLAAGTGRIEMLVVLQ
jgi:hypothetical protein